jgi:MFS family permease
MFLRRQAGATDAVVPLPMLRNREFAACLAVATTMNFGAYAMLFLTPLYFQAVRGTSALGAAVLLLPMSVSYMMTSQVSGRIANKLGPRVPMTAGMGLMGLGLLILALIPFNDSLVLIETGLLAMGCGLGLNVGPMNAVAVANVPAARSGTASGLINTARMIGATLGVAVLGAVFAMHVAQGVVGTRGLAPAYLGGGIGELIGAAVAFAFIRHDSLRPPAQRGRQ